MFPEQAEDSAVAATAAPTTSSDPTATSLLPTIEEVAHAEPPAVIEPDEAAAVAAEQYGSYVLHRAAGAMPEEPIPPPPAPLEPLLPQGSAAPLEPEFTPGARNPSTFRCFCERRRARPTEISICL